MFRLAWGLKVNNEFRQRVFKMCRNFGWSHNHANWIMSSMAFETGETFSPRIVNAAGSGAVGLIQFMPSTARALGTDSIALMGMEAHQQLDYVEKYFKPYAKRIGNLPDMYMAILLPKYVGQPNNSPLFSGGTAYRQNSGLDANKDGVVTKEEAAAKVQAKLVRGMSFATEEVDIYP